MILAFYTESRIYYQYNKQYNKNVLYLHLPTFVQVRRSTRCIHTDSHWPDIVGLCFLTCTVGLALTATRFKSSIQTCHGISRPQGYTTDKQRHKQADGQKARRTDKQMDRHTERETSTDRQIDSKTETNSQTDPHRGRQATDTHMKRCINKQTNNHKLTQHWSRRIRAKTKWPMSSSL